MKYLCMAYGERAKMEALSPEQLERLIADCQAHDEELRRTGKLLAGYSLEWDATTIRPRGGKPVVSDGPFVETKEQVGGLVLIEADDLNDAIRLASLHPAAQMGEELGWAIEIRALTTCGAQHSKA